ncbi:hypothetical protein ACFO3I_17035 [Rheinheimera marina]|uniref:DUF1579 domain-containing protein n=1 Tax=Rheinheimera marina TaxID=1774958 RepID=A0ABV9JR52_9GAMM
MKCIAVLLVSVVWLAQAAEPVLHPKLEVFRPLLNSFWQGDLTEPGKTETMIDKSSWLRVLNGQAIKTIHSINEGAYGGESMIFWDEKQQSLAYYYFTTAGFYTHGTMQVDEVTGAIVALEQVENNAQGITQVRSRSVMQGEKLVVESEYLKNGDWVKGHSAVYQRTAPTEIIFR